MNKNPRCIFILVTLASTFAVTLGNQQDTDYFEASDKYYVQTWDEAKVLPAWIFGLIMATLGLLVFFAVIVLFTLTFCDFFHLMYSKYCKKKIRNCRSK